MELFPFPWLLVSTFVLSRHVQYFPYFHASIQFKIGEAFSSFNSLVEILCFHDQVATYQFLALGEGTIGHYFVGACQSLRFR